MQQSVSNGRIILHSSGSAVQRRARTDVSHGNGGEEEEGEGVEGASEW